MVGYSTKSPVRLLQTKRALNVGLPTRMRRSSMNNIKNNMPPDIVVTPAGVPATVFTQAQRAA
jgi:hypothetical protein